MKRILYITLAAVAFMLSACSERPIDPTPQMPGSSGSYIFFEPEVLERVETRTSMLEGTSLPSASGTSFGVFGYAGSTVLFDDKMIYRSEDGGLFTYDGLVNWVDGVTPHDFYAYYPYDLTASVGDNNIPYIPYTQSTDRNSMVDILTATTGSITKKSIVDLKFYHRLWAMDITVKNNRKITDKVYVPHEDPKKDGSYVDTGNDVTIKSIKVEFDGIPASGNIYMDGSVVLGEMLEPFSYSVVYDNPDDTSDEPLILTTADGQNSITVTGQDSFLFLPCGSFNYRITLECVSTWGVEYTAHHPATYTEDEDGIRQWDWATAKGPGASGFKAGNRYTLDIVKSDYNVTFDWVETNWGEWDEVAEKWTNIEVVHTFK